MGLPVEDKREMVAFKLKLFIVDGLMENSWQNNSKEKYGASNKTKG